MEVRKNVDLGENGLFSTKNVNKGDVVFTLSGEIFDKPTRETIYVGDNKHIHDKHGIFINHSFVPSVKIDGMNVVANIDITPGDEITFNYNDNELEMANPFMSDGQMVCGNNLNLR